MDKFKLEECGECSKWEALATCKKTNKQLKLSVSYCTDEDEYLFDTTGMEDDCIETNEYKAKKNKMENYINKHFKDFKEVECKSFNKETPDPCPSCNNSIEPGLHY